MHLNSTGGSESLNHKETIQPERWLRAAIIASGKIPWPDDYALLDDIYRAQDLEAEYWKARQRWIQKSGQQLPSREELAKLPEEKMRMFRTKLREIISLLRERLPAPAALDVTVHADASNEDQPTAASSQAEVLSSDENKDGTEEL